MLCVRGYSKYPNDPDANVYYILKLRRFLKSYRLLVFLNIIVNFNTTHSLLSKQPVYNTTGSENMSRLFLI